ncbi:TolC family protein [Methyloversatilis thermotolerans]|uniref:TolC family protein n=1 Tax=Methyloversatilis thermotolerans TaxID=1346290 RepID=UPI0003670C6F|nr:TolC family protein [Methyloversatilis thermotolerans]
MPHPTRRLLPIALLLVLSSCAVRHVERSPIDPLEGESLYRARALDDDATRDWLAQRDIDVSAWPLPAWNGDALVTAALREHPALARAAAATRAARGAVQTAGLRPRMTLSPDIERSNERDAGQSAWSIGLALDLALTGQSVREARIERAQRLVDAAVLDQAEVVWNVRSRARRGLLELWSAEGELALLAQLAQRWQSALTAVQSRYDLGASDALELGLMRSEAMRAESRRIQARQRVLMAHGELADALALPLDTLSGLRLDFSEFEDAPVPDSTPALPSLAALRAGATLNRIDLRRALARHAASEAALQIELRAQYPEIRLQPGLLWDQGATVWQLGAALPLFMTQRQAGPIAEAIARRDEAAQDFLALQSQALAALDVARSRWMEAGLDTRSARNERDEASRHAARMAQRFGRGDADRLDNLLAGVRALEADIRLLQARTRSLSAVLAIENALQRPLVEPAGKGATP